MSDTANDLAGAIDGFIDGLKAKNMDLERQRDAYAETLRELESQRTLWLTVFIRERHPELAP